MIVYVYTFPNGKKYVGQTTKTLEERARNGSGYNTQLVGKAIQKYGWQNVQKEIFECQNEEEMNSLERDLIEAYNTTDTEFGYNLDSGGNFEKHHSEETKRKIGIANHNNYKDGNHPRKGSRLSPERIEKMREDAYQSKKVICLETKEIFPSAAAAARSVGAKKGANIQAVCNGAKSRNSAYGFHWAWIVE